MSSNVGLSTPRGSGTSGYVQRNSAFLKPRNAGYGAPYPPVPSSAADDKGLSSFRQRKPDQQILDHDRKRAIELQVLEERERLEEENEELEKDKKKPLTEEEIDERCDALRVKLLKQLEEGDKSSSGNRGDRRKQQRGGQYDKDRRQLKSYQIHELAEAKIQESERLRKALGIKEDWEKKDSSPSVKENEKPGRSEDKEDGGQDREQDERRDRRRRYS
ncbi:hypothetical protein EYB26_000281 [Talaromyces marneffei]|uniref:uncharacterized protein n=1 Tax=Talaromyces marneffei TaxID=37727 RepID=UPI0012AA82C0|nr:uncharacterized protein EYB26_000281 [Talaromyces marneffei]QGA12637.1 hypothetical protein EYB26_000281 [Talaromyces marneffei]